MKKPLLCILGLASALAFSMPILGVSSADAATAQNQHRLHEKQPANHHHHYNYYYGHYHCYYHNHHYYYHSHRCYYHR